MRLKTRVLTISAAALVGLILMGSFGIYSMHESITNERTARVSLLLDFAKAQLAFFQKKEAAGELSREEAQTRAKEAIFAQQTKSDYFIVRDLADNRLLVHATVSRIGKIDSGGKTPDGRMVSEVYKEKIKESANGKAYVVLEAKRPNSADEKLYPKLNGATVFEPWNWMVIIGFFQDDVDSQMWQDSAAFSIAGLLLLALLTGLSFLLIRSITAPLREIQQVMTIVGKNNDFTKTVVVHSKDEIGQMAQTFNELLATLRETFTHFRASTTAVSTASEGMVIASKASADASALTSQAASSMAASVEEMSASIDQVSDNAQHASELARKAGHLSVEGGEVIANTVKEMNQIADSIDRVSGPIGQLGTQSNKISSIVQVIKEVADQTNLLALNAAIEAARAGEAGRGFAVVADEVRKLADRTTKATGEISVMIGDIQTSSQSAVSAMQRTVEQVQSGRQMAEQAGQAIVEIRTAASDVVSVIEGIACSFEEQSGASQSIAQQLEQIAQAAEENSSTSIETSDSAHHLGDLANEMQTMSGKFII